MSGFTKEGLLFSFVFAVSGCVHQQANQTNSHNHEHSHDHGSESHGYSSHSHSHSHEHGDTHGSALHHGIVVPLFSAQQQVGFAELKLHDDKGDLELWVTKDEVGSNPIDLPLNAQIAVAFPQLATQQVTLRVRNMAQNEDEDGKANIRANKTNYFIFPGDTGADASFLMGKAFSAETVISFEVGGVTYSTAAFTLRPHTH